MPLNAVSSSRGALTYAIAGLNIRSDLALPAPETAAHPQVTMVLMDPRPVPSKPPSGEVWLDAELAPELRTMLARHGEGYLLRYLGICDVEIASGVEHLAITPDPIRGPQLVGPLAGASILSVVLALRGRTAMHASCVAIGSKAVAIIGLSGAGKSTLSAALCSGGAALVSDDLLCIDPSSEQFRVPFCSNQIRLRDPGIAQRLGIPTTSLRQTADGRWAYFPPRLATSGAELAAIVFPQVSSGPTSGLERLGADKVLASLSADGRRTMGVIHPDWLRRDFLTFVRLAREVPTYLWRLKRGDYAPAALCTEVGRLLNAS